MTDDLAKTDSHNGQLTVALLFLEALLDETLSRDAVSLAADAALRRAIDVGVPDEVAKECMGRLLRFANKRHKHNPLHSMF